MLSLIFTMIFYAPCIKWKWRWKSSHRIKSGMPSLFTITWKLQNNSCFLSIIIIHHHHNQSIKCLMFDLLATQLSETADRQVWPGRRSSAVARRTAPAARDQPGSAVPPRRLTFSPLYCLDET